MTGHAAWPNWVAQRDGRLAPFDGDKICRAIFAASERLGQPDPFLARELTDGVLHFLAADGTADPLPSAEIAEVVVKTVRELGHPALALAYERDRCKSEIRNPKSETGGSDFGFRISDFGFFQRPADGVAGDGLPLLVNSAIKKLLSEGPCARVVTRRVAAAVLEEFSRRNVYSRDLVAAERDGLLHFWDCDTPLELAGAVIPPTPPAAQSAGPGWVETLEAARERVGQYIAIDSPEFVLASSGSPDTAAAWVRELRIGLRLTGLRAVVNLNCSVPPASVSAGTSGPLFAPLPPSDEQRFGDFRDALLDHLFDADDGNLRVDWHLSDRDFEPAGRQRLLRLARRVLDGVPLAFVPDRPRRPIALAEGLDRQQTTMLSVVGISLSRLVEIVRSTAGANTDPAVYLSKLGSLARLALSAGRARRTFLLGHARPEVSRGFTIDRARLVVVPLGLAETVRQVIGQPLTPGGAGLDFARHVWQSLAAALGHDQTRRLQACLDSLPPLPRHGITSPVSACSSVAMDGTPRQQMRAAGALQTEVEAGTAVVSLPAEHRSTPEDLADLLWSACQQPGLVRVRFVRDVPVPKQLSAGWDTQLPS